MFEKTIPLIPWMMGDSELCQMNCNSKYGLLGIMYFDVGAYLVPLLAELPLAEPLLAEPLLTVPLLALPVLTRDEVIVPLAEPVVVSPAVLPDDSFPEETCPDVSLPIEEAPVEVSLPATDPVTLPLALPVAEGSFDPDCEVGDASLEVGELNGFPDESVCDGFPEERAPRPD